MSTENATVQANNTVNFSALLEKAIRNKVRFDTPRGQLSVEDLFDLPLTGTTTPNLDAITVALDTQLKANSAKVVSFVKPTPAKQDFTQLKFDIALYILTEKMAERDARAVAADKAAQRQKLLAALESAEQGELQKMSPAEIRAALDALK